MPELPYTLLDVFTARPLQGNPLAVVHDAGAVPDEIMRAFARETRLSETSLTLGLVGLSGGDRDPGLPVQVGVEMGRPSRLRAAVEGDRVCVGGDVVVVVDGTVHLDF